MQMKQLALLFAFSVSGLGAAACSSDAGPPINTIPQAGSNSSAGATSAGASSAGAGGTAASAGAGGTGTTAGTAGTTSTAGTGGTSGGMAGAGGGTTTMSAGCGKALPATVKLGQWSMMADTLGAAGNPPPLMVPCVPDPLNLAWPACVNGMVKRGYFVYVKAGYDPNKPSRVIYEGAGCDAQNDAGATAGYKYQDIPSTDPQTIFVGLTYSRSADGGKTGNCYDNKNPTSSDFAYMPLLQAEIEKQFCVDTSRNYFSGYSTGAWVGNQYTCAMPERFRAMVFATGEEPMLQPTCKANPPPVAALFLHDDKDTYNTPARMSVGCARLLKQNGCMTTQCDWHNASLTESYPVPASVTNPPASLQCVKFKGCPETKPVVWCYTDVGGTGQAGEFARHYINVSAWITPLFWDFMNKY